MINTKLPSCVGIIHRTSLGFPSWCPESTRPMDSCFQGTSCENLMMYGGLYQHTRVVLHINLTIIGYQILDSGGTDRIVQRTLGKYRNGLVGCIRNVTLATDYHIQLTEEAAMGQNIEECI